MTPKDYNKDFFQFQQSESYQSAQIISPLINEWIKPSDVVDIGCGIGAWLKVFKDLQVKHVTGFDGSYVNTESLLIDKSEFIVADLEKPVLVKNKSDLAICLEVAEHLTPNRAENFVLDLCNAADVILFSAAIPGQGGTRHINEQYPDYWIEKFGINGFECIDCIRPIIWNNKEVEVWYRQNIMLFVKNDQMSKYDFLKKMPSFFGYRMVSTLLFERRTNRMEAYFKILNNPLRVIRYYLRCIYDKLKR